MSGAEKTTTRSLAPALQGEEGSRGREEPLPPRRFLVAGAVAALAIGIGAAGGAGSASARSLETANDPCPNPEGFTLSEAQLRAAVAAHARWASDPATGARAVLCRLIAPGAELAGVRLARADLRFSNLEGARLAGADLREARLQLANLEGADLSEADLRGANLYRARAAGARLEGVRADGARLRKIAARAVVLVRADLTGVDLGRSDLREARLEDAILVGANLRKDDLRGARMARARLVSTNLRKADLRGADLTAVILSGADLRRARLEGATFYEASLDSVLGLTGAELAALDRSPRPAPPGARAQPSPAGEGRAVLEHGGKGGAAAPGAGSGAEPVAPPRSGVRETARTGGRFGVQLGAYRQEQAALRALHALERDHRQALGTGVLRVERAERSGGTWHRVRLGGFATRVEASRWCERYRSETGGAPCIVYRAGADGG